MAIPPGRGITRSPELHTSLVPVEELRRLAASEFLAAYAFGQPRQLAPNSREVSASSPCTTRMRL